MARVAVIGPGSVGVFFAGHLAAAGHDVLACARRPFERYVIESDEYPLDIEASVAIDPSAVQAPADWVLLAVKAHQTPGAASWLEALCTPATRVMILQNGIEHDLADGYVNGADTIPTVVYCGAGLVEPGRIAHTSSGFLIVPDEPHGKEMLGLFEESQADVRPTSDFVTHAWRKLSMNVTLNGLTALTGRKMGIIKRPDIRSIAIDLVRESWQVAAADGANLDPAGAEAVVDAIIDRGIDEGTSMYFDTMAGRATEHDAIHGAALRRAEHHGIEVPTIRFMHALLDARDPSGAAAATNG